MWQPSNGGEQLSPDKSMGVGGRETTGDASAGGDPLGGRGAQAMWQRGVGSQGYTMGWWGGTGDRDSQEMHQVGW